MKGKSKGKRKLSAGQQWYLSARKDRGIGAIDQSVYAKGIHVFSDGACDPNPGPGGWAFVVYEDGLEVYNESGGAPDTTNNQMEMSAALFALMWMSLNCAGRVASLHCDSRYVVDGCNDWRHKWKDKGWKRGQSEVKNLGLWQSLDDVLTVYPVTVNWCKGHAGIEGNERADKLSMVALKNRDTIRDSKRDSEQVWKISKYNDFQILKEPTRGSKRDTARDSTGTAAGQQRDSDRGT